jgi:hypothetical protein
LAIQGRVSYTIRFTRRKNRLVMISMLVCIQKQTNTEGYHGLLVNINENLNNQITSKPLEVPPIGQKDSSQPEQNSMDWISGKRCLAIAVFRLAGSRVWNRSGR